jgi:hypothetical protein
MRITASALSLMMVSGSAAFTLWLSPTAWADGISPGIRDTGKTYSKDAPDINYYGTGIGGRMEEAAMLRFQIDRALQDANLDLAITKARKACQLDPETPDNHVLLARAMTRKLTTQGGNIDRKMLSEAMAEWKMLWVHDADQDDQFEAKMNYMRLRKTSIALARRKQAEEKERQKAKIALAQKSTSDERAVKKQTANGGGDAKAETSPAGNKSTQDSNSTDSSSTATPTKHKRFLLF